MLIKARAEREKKIPFVLTDGMRNRGEEWEDNERMEKSQTAKKIAKMHELVTSVVKKLQFKLSRFFVVVVALRPFAVH